jgi:hypothetical protein
VSVPDFEVEGAFDKAFQGTIARVVDCPIRQTSPVLEI